MRSFLCLLRLQLEACIVALTFSSKLSMVMVMLATAFRLSEMLACVLVVIAMLHATAYLTATDGYT